MIWRYFWGALCKLQSDLKQMFHWNCCKCQSFVFAWDVAGFTFALSCKACMAASLHRAPRSAPTKPVVLCASSAMSTPGHTGILSHRTDKMAFLCLKVGAPMMTWRKDKYWEAQRFIQMYPHLFTDPRTYIVHLQLENDEKRHRTPHLSVKSSRPAQCWVQAVRPVGGSNDQEAIGLIHPVHQCEKLSHQPILWSRRACSPRKQRVQLIQEQNTGTFFRCRPSALKHSPQRLLTLTRPGPHHLKWLLIIFISNLLHL